MRLAIWIAYDGSGFRGFAPNPGVPTISQELEEALATVLGEIPVLTCAGRTDAGVHGRAQCVTFDVSDDSRALRNGLDTHAIERSLNALCGPAIVVWHVAQVPESFDARFSAASRTYRYTVLNRRLPDPLRRGRVWHVWEPIDRELLAKAVPFFLGTHDFSSFCRRRMVRTRDGDMEAARVRTVLAAEWRAAPEDPDELTFEITATSFCQQMVRSIVGTSVDVGRGRVELEEIPAILDAHDRRAAGTVAPPDGLVLWEVGYARTDETAVFLPDLP